MSSRTRDDDRTVYVGNLPGEKVTDEELIDFFKPFGKISDIRVFKDHLLVQYHRVEQANDLLSQRSLTFRGNQLEICPSSRKRSVRTTEPVPKRFHSSESHKQRGDRRHLYSILSGPTDVDELVDCQILLVNIRQRNYADQIESRLIAEGLRTSIRLLREDFTLIEAIQLASQERCLYAIIAMPMHEERRTGSFHILYGQTEEHRNLTLEDGFHILLTNYSSYKERLRQLELNPSRETTKVESSQPNLSLNDRFPLSMLLCLLADGRQLTLEEIDRVLVYLLEKKAKMLTLPSGTLPPLPVQYVTGPLTTERETNPIKVDNSLSSTLAEQIRQILTNSIVPPVIENPSLTPSIKSEHSNVMNTGYSLPSTYPTFKSNPLTSNYSLPPANLYSLSLTDPIYHSFPQMPPPPPPPLNPKQEN